MDYRISRPYKDFPKMYEAYLSFKKSPEDLTYICTVLEHCPSNNSIQVEVDLSDSVWGPVLEDLQKRGQWNSGNSTWLMGKVNYPTGDNMPYNAFLCRRFFVRNDSIRTLQNRITGKFLVDEGVVYGKLD